MTTHINHKIYGIVEAIKKTEKMIQLHQSEDDPADAIMKNQFEIRKIKLLRELLSELTLSGLSMKTTKGIIQRLAAFIEKAEEQFGKPDDSKYDLSEVERLVAI